MDSPYNEMSILLVSIQIDVVPGNCINWVPRCMFLSADGSYLALGAATFRVYQTMAELLLGSTGVVRPFSDFLSGTMPSDVDQCFSMLSGQTLYIYNGTVATISFVCVLNQKVFWVQ